MATQQVEWKMTAGGLKAFIDGTPITWFPQPGSQEAFLRCPIFECLLAGNRGGGKTEALLMDFAQHVGKGFGSDWRGILFRRTQPELEDIIEKSLKWFPMIWPDAEWKQQAKTWRWKTGEFLRFRHTEKPKDYLKYHGHSFPWIGFEELTNWENDECYKVMMSCCRSAIPGMPHHIRATTNPYGPGHNWVKRRFRLPIAEGSVIGPVIRDSKNKAGDIEPPRVAIRSSLFENKILLISDPEYLNRIRAAARNEAELMAWVEGSWDITSGGMFDDLWDEHIHLLPNIEYEDLPRGWLLNRAYDHGQSKPFAVQWWAQSNGEPIVVKGRKVGAVKGDLILFNEWYGCEEDEDNVGIRMEATNIAQGIKDREKEMGLKGRIKRGPADDQINEKTDGARSVAGLMKKKGIYWDDSVKGPNSRKNGWQIVRDRLTASKPVTNADGTAIREEPGLFVCERCLHWRRTVPNLSRLDRDLDDVNTKTEDHHGDATRYRLTWKRKIITRQKF